MKPVARFLTLAFFLGALAAMSASRQTAYEDLIQRGRDALQANDGRAISSFLAADEDARRRHDRAGRVVALRLLGRAYVQGSDLERARSAFEAALGQKPEARVAAWTRLELANVLVSLGKPDAANAVAQAALKSFADASKLRLTKVAQRALVDISLQAGDLDQAQYWLRKLISLAGSEYRLGAEAASALGRIQFERRDLAAARDAHIEAADLFLKAREKELDPLRRASDDAARGESLIDLSAALFDLGERTRSDEKLQEALGIAERLGGRESAAILVRAADALGRQEIPGSAARALAISERAGDRYRATGDFEGELRTLNNSLRYADSAGDDEAIARLGSRKPLLSTATSRLYGYALGLQGAPEENRAEDARRVASAFEATEGFGEKVRMICDPPLRRPAQVRQRLQGFQAEMRPRDTFVLFLSGEVEAGDGPIRLRLPQADGSSTTIGLDEIATLIELIPARRKLIVADFGQDGSLLVDTPVMRRLARLGQIHATVSSPGPGFVDAIVNGLAGQADRWPEDGIVTTRELDRYVHAEAGGTDETVPESAPDWTKEFVLAQPPLDFRAPVNASPIARLAALRIPQEPEPDDGFIVEPAGFPARRGKDFGAFVGMTHYLAWPVIDGAIKDSVDLADTLEGRFGFNAVSLGVDEGTWRLPDCKSPMELFNYLCDKLELMRKARKGFLDEDQLLLYIAGHGGQFERKEQQDLYGPFLACLDTPVTDWSPHDVLLLRLIQNMIDSPDESDLPSHILILLDTCYSGGFPYRAIIEQSEFGSTTESLNAEEKKIFEYKDRFRGFAAPEATRAVDGPNSLTQALIERFRAVEPSSLNRLLAIFVAINEKENLGSRRPRYRFFARQGSTTSFMLQSEP